MIGVLQAAAAPGVPGQMEAGAGGPQGCGAADISHGVCSGRPWYVLSCLALLVSSLQTISQVLMMYCVTSPIQSVNVYVAWISFCKR